MLHRVFYLLTTPAWRIRARVTSSALGGAPLSLALVTLFWASAHGFDGFNINSSTFDQQYNGDQIWNGTDFLNEWSQAGGATTSSLSLNASTLIVNNDANNGWLQQDSGTSPWESAVGNWTLEVSAKLTDTDADADAFVLWGDAAGSQIIVRVTGDSVGYNTGGAALLSGVDNTDAFHAYRIAFDASNPTGGPNGTYHVWRDNVPISGVGVGRTAAAATTRLIVGDCCTSIGNPVDQFEIGYVRYDLDGAFSPIPDQGLLELQIDRGSGQIRLANSTSAPLANIIGYSLLSSSGSLSQAGWDKQATGTALLNDNDQWTVLTGAGVANDLSESVLVSSGAKNGGDLAASNGVWSFGNVWNKSPFEDVTLQLLLDDGTILSTATGDLALAYTGNGGAPFAVGDLDYDGDVDPTDWRTFKTRFHGSNLAPFGTPADHRAQLYNAGDLNGDGAYSLADYQTFVVAYDAANGAGAFAASVVPEPGTCLLLILCGTTLMTLRRHKTGTRDADQRMSVNRTGLKRIGLRRIGTVAAVSLLIGTGGRTASALTKLDSSAFDNKYNGNQIWNGASFVNQWSQAGGATAASLSLNGTNLIQDNDANNGWVQHDDNDTTPWEQGSGSFTVEITAKLNDTDAAEADGFTLWAELGGATTGNRQILWVQNDSINLLDGTELVSGIDNADKLHLLRLAYDATDVTAGPEGTYHAWWDGLKISGAGIARQAAATVDSRLIVGDCCTSIGNPVDQYEVGYVRYDMDGAFEPQFLAELKLKVDLGTGAVSIVNDGSPIDFHVNGYSITSAGSLAVGGWNSLEDQNIAVDPTPANKDNGDSWEEFDNASSAFIGEGFLLGSTTVLNGGSLALGSLFTPGSAQDLAFSFNATNGGTIQGVVEYVGVAGLAADFDGDGDVDGQDYARWQGDFGVNGDSDANNDGDSDGMDFLAWQRQFGRTAPGASSAATSVPEPTSALLAAAAALALGASVRRSLRRVLFAIAVIAAATSGSPTHAAVFNDRHYTLGDLSNIGFDSQGVNTVAFPGAVDSGAFADLINNGGIASVNVGPTGLKRPGLASSANGARFDGVDDAFTTAVGFNSPNQTWNFADYYPTSLIPPDVADDMQYDPPSATGADGPDPDTSYTPAFPHNYLEIFGRGIQLWAHPTGLGTAARQDLVMDTQQHGIYITAADTWGLQFDGPPTSAPNNGAKDSGVSVASSLDANGWAHVMELSGFGDIQGGGSALGGALLVNGVAVAATGTFYDPDTTGLSIGSNVANDGNYYKGELDEVRLFLWGDNSEQAPAATNTALGYLGGANWGSLDLGVDNDWIKQKLASMNVTSRGDVDLDGNIDSDDATAFITHWRKRNLVDGVQVGDWLSRQQGDLNYDGIVDLGDAFLAHEALQGVGLELNFALLGAPVPEPSAVVLAFVGLGALARRRRRA